MTLGGPSSNHGRMPATPDPTPSALPDDEDLIGEAEESEAAMPGLELDEESVRARQVAEQISELIKEKPEEAAILVGKWVEVEE